MENFLEKCINSEIEHHHFLPGSMLVFEGEDPLLKLYGHVYPQKNAPIGFFECFYENIH